MKKISIICVVRNDEYGLNQVDRTIGFLKSLNEIPNKQSYEIIFVEWNPLQNEISFYEKYLDYFPSNINYKIVTVSKQTHESIYNPLQLPLFEYYGKNVGARHTSTDFFIFTNPDNIFFPQTWVDIESYISEDYFIRLCRSDVRIKDLSIIHNTKGVETIKSLMQNHFHFYEAPVYHLNKAEFYEEMTEGFIWEINHEGASGDFFGISKKNFYKLKGYREYWTYGVYDGLICRDSKKIGLNQIILPKYSVHIDHLRPHLGSKQMTDYNMENVNGEDWGLHNKNGISVMEFI